jgi:hypothetical protein
VAGASPGQTILGALAVAVLLFVQSFVSRRFQSRNHAEVAEKLDVVEESVNGTHTALTERVEQLAQALQAAGVSVPPTPGTEEA